MAEYITKEQVIDWYRPYGHMDKPIQFEILVSDLRDMKAADVAPVRHGRWINGDQYCPICKKDKFRGLDADIWSDWKPDYCPNCGARMDGDCHADD